MSNLLLGECPRTFIKTVRFQPDTIQRVIAAARELGVSPARLIYDAALSRVEQVEHSKSKTSVA